MNSRDLLNVSGAALLSVVAVSVAILFVVPNSEKSFAYIEFDGGYTSLGYISGISYEMEVSITTPSGDVYKEGFDDVVRELSDFGSDTAVVENFTLNITSAYVYSGSAQEFSLILTNDKITSDGSTKGSEWLQMISDLNEKQKTNYRTLAEQSLRFEKAPQGENPFNIIKNLISQFMT